MARPIGSWRNLKRVARYMLGVKAVKWVYKWQEEPTHCHVTAESEWGGNVKDRKSTSGGGWMLGDHCIETWSASQGPYALSSAEAEFYAMIEAVTRAKGLLSLAGEMGFVRAVQYCSSRD